ncbi:hypothetical protein CORT_0A11190 [Candida orthopsilosis Co 90-125]|uniref:Rgp1 protein n=1 Tax=Candida orthopsilosis (strain 90-125) TaxID=1136231 RepID=H8WXJ8_CANO9|nr:hypothetical protein CORT_0A11190 [Candida orthopsilosis Co 90-125]CCG21504.1 hypothetical protein CORT_0A11190 [Candida orthopsilosis Co 90-125]
MPLKTPSSSCSGRTYKKRLHDSLLVSLSYLEVDNDGSQICELTFQNTSKKDLTVNPTELTTAKSNAEEESSWLPSFFKSSTKTEESTKLVPSTEDESVALFLGHVQLFGYVVLNYKFPIDTSSLDMNRHQQWWNNVEYLNQYWHSEEEEEEGDEKDPHIIVENTPFIAQQLESKLTIGGNLGGVKDLIVNEYDSKPLQVNPTFLHDLINVFDSYPKSNSSLPLKDLTDTIVPIYTTPQSLLFSDLKIPKNSLKSFKFSVPVNDKLPPSYSTRSTGPACDQGWVSTRYALVISLQENSIVEPAKTIYFPFNIVPHRYVSNKVLQRFYFEEPPGLDKTWTVKSIDDEAKNSPVANGSSAKADFLKDLSDLIESDVYNMPKVSTTERRKSSIKTTSTEISDESLYTAQIPSNLKTSYQLKINDDEVCKISISKPYYHVGEDIHFKIEMKLKDKESQIIGLIAYLEAYETYHLREGGRHAVNKYEVSGNIKINTLAAALTNLNGAKATVSEYINIPKYLSPQYQSKSFMDLTYWLNFQLNFAKLAEEDVGATDLCFKSNTFLRSDAIGNTQHFKVPIHIISSAAE